MNVQSKYELRVIITGVVLVTFNLQKKSFIRRIKDFFISSISNRF